MTIGTRILLIVLNGCTRLHATFQAIKLHCTKFETKRHQHKINAPDVMAVFMPQRRTGMKHYQRLISIVSFSFINTLLQNAYKLISTSLMLRHILTWYVPA